VTVWAQTPIGLRASAHLHGILIGTAVIVNHIRQNIDYKQYSEKIQRDSVILVTENELKPTRIWQGEGIYNWNDSDFLLGATLNSTGWAQQNLMQIRGHTLVWPDDRHIPKWLLDQESSITSDKAKSLLSDYIHNVVGRYRGKILWWDVINEAINDSDNTNPLNLRDSFWMRKLGPDFLKFAFQFAKAADPNVKLYYNDYGIESVGLKATRTLNLVNWLRSQGATVHGIGLQWHIDVSRSITRGDGHYQIAQQFINNQLDITVTELDVTIPTSSGYLIDRADLYRQGSIYRAVLEYAIHFYPKCQALLTWGFTDRYSWLPEYHKTSKGAGLPLDWMYLPKPAYWEMQEVMTRVVVDGVYRLSPQLQPDKCLGASTNVNNSDVQLYSGECNNTNQKWNITWLGDGTYRFSLQSSKNRVLGAYDTKASVGQVQTYNWLDDVNQGWAFSAKGNNIFRIVPRTAWWRVMTVNGTSNIGIVDYFTSRSQHWILTKV
jgi:endo-1,4-beta-xylanase